MSSNRPRYMQMTAGYVLHLRCMLLRTMPQLVTVCTPGVILLHCCSEKSRRQSMIVNRSYPQPPSASGLRTCRTPATSKPAQTVLVLWLVRPRHVHRSHRSSQRNGARLRLRVTVMRPCIPPIYAPQAPAAPAPPASTSIHNGYSVYSALQHRMQKCCV